MERGTWQCGAEVWAPEWGRVLWQERLREVAHAVEIAFSCGGKVCIATLEERCGLLAAVAKQAVKRARGKLGVSVQAQLRLQAANCQSQHHLHRLRD